MEKAAEEYGKARRKVEILHGETGFFICLVSCLPFLLMLLQASFSSMGTSPLIQIYRESLRFLFFLAISDDLLLFIFTLVAIIVPMKLGIFDGSFFSPQAGVESTDHNQFPTEPNRQNGSSQFYEMGNLHCEPTLMDDETVSIKQPQKGVPDVPHAIPVSKSSDRKTCPRSPYRRSPLNEKQQEVGLKSFIREPSLSKLERKEMGKSWISMMTDESKSLVGEWTLPTMDELVCSEQVLDPIPQCPVPGRRETSRDSKTESISTASTSSYESTLLTTEEETPPVPNGFSRRRRRRRARALSKSFGELMELKSKDEETVSVDRYPIPDSKSSVRKNPPPPYKWTHFGELPNDPNRSETESTTRMAALLSESSGESTLFTTEEERSSSSSSSDSASSNSPKRPSLFKIQFSEDAFGGEGLKISPYRLPDGEWGFSFSAA